MQFLIICPNVEITPQSSFMCTYNYMRHYALCVYPVVSIKYYNLMNGNRDFLVGN